jgi:hypothetical protein
MVAQRHLSAEQVVRRAKSRILGCETRMPANGRVSLDRIYRHTFGRWLELIHCPWGFGSGHSAFVQ